MGWGRMMLMGNVGQQLDIQDVENAVAQLQSVLQQTQNLDSRQERDINELHKENQELKLYLATLVKLLVAKGVIQPEEVEAAVNTVEKN